MGFFDGLSRVVRTGKQAKVAGDAMRVLGTYYRFVPSAERQKKLWPHLVEMADLLNEHELAAYFLALYAKDIDPNIPEAAPQLVKFRGVLLKACENGFVSNSLVVEEFCDGLRKHGVDTTELRAYT